MKKHGFHAISSWILFAPFFLPLYIYPMKTGVLLKWIEALMREVQKLREEVREVAPLKKENSLLKERLAKFENPKNSRNSSVPPSIDDNRPLKTQSLRKKGNKEVGGQPGHKGNTLRMASNPDNI